MEAKAQAQFLRKALQTAYCTDYSTYLNIFSIEEDTYALAKFRQFQTNFLQWYCELDYNHAIKYCRYVIEK